MPVAAPVELREQAHALYVAGKPVCEIGQQLQIRADTVSQWANRYKWQTERKTVGLTVQRVITSRITDVLSDESQKVRKALSDAISRQATVLNEVKSPTLASLRNTPARQGLAAVTKTVIDSAATLYGWDADKTVGMLDMTAPREIEATVVSETTGIQPPLVVSDESK